MFFQYFLKLRYSLQNGNSHQMRFLNLQFLHKRIIDHDNHMFLIDHADTDINIMNNTLGYKIHVRRLPYLIVGHFEKLNKLIEIILRYHIRNAHRQIEERCDFRNGRHICHSYPDIHHIRNMSRHIPLLPQCHRILNGIICLAASRIIRNKMIL